MFEGHVASEAFVQHAHPDALVHILRRSPAAVFVFALDGAHANLATVVRRVGVHVCPSRVGGDVSVVLVGRIISVFNVTDRLHSDNGAAWHTLQTQSVELFGCFRHDLIVSELYGVSVMCELICGWSE